MFLLGCSEWCQSIAMWLLGCFVCYTLVLYFHKAFKSHNVTLKRWNTHIWNDDSELGIQCVIHLPNGTFVTPEWVVLLCVLCVRVSCCGENLVPGCGIAVGLWDTVRWLPAEDLQNKAWITHSRWRKLKSLFFKNKFQLCNPNLHYSAPLCTLFLFCFGCLGQLNINFWVVSYWAHKQIYRENPQLKAYGNIWEHILKIQNT